MATRIDMTNYFDSFGKTAVPGSIPVNAFAFGLVIQDRNIRGVTAGIRDSHIPFQYLSESGIPPWAKSANWSDIEVGGRFENIQAYSHSNNQEFNIELMYHAEGTEELKHKTPWTLENITRICTKLESLVFPQYDNKFSPPNFCILNIGSVYIDFPVIIKNVTITSEAPFRQRDLMPRTRKVTLDLKSSFPIYQAISSGDIMNSVSEKGVRESGGILNPRNVYAYRKFKKRQNL